MAKSAWIVALLLCAGGCSGVDLVQVDPPRREGPPMDVPLSLREWNWGGGSCVHASTVVCLRWMHKEPLAAWWRKTYSGGETASGLKRKLDRAEVPYAYTYSGDVEFLEWASRTRRGAVIFYYPVHSINFNGFSWRGGKEYAVLLDNNRIENFIWVEKSTFVREWKGYGGFALTPLFPPTPPQPWSPYMPRAA